MKQPLLTVPVIILLGCSGGGGTSPDAAQPTPDAAQPTPDAVQPTPDEPTPATDTGSVDLDVPPATSGCPGQRVIAFNAPVRGDTTAPGWDARLTEWFARSDVACSPATMFDATNAPYQVYALDMPPRADWEIYLEPDPGVNANLAAVWQQSTSETGCIPLINRRPAAACEYGTRGGPGMPERVRLNAATVGYRVVVLVNTPRGFTGGGFSLVARPYGTTGPVDAGPPTDTGAGPVDAGPSPAVGCPGDQEIAFGTDVRGDTTRAGWDARLTEWFARSDVACSPATMFDATNAPYQVYTLDMPPRSDWTVLATPDPGVNVNLAAVWQQTAGDTSCRPLLDRAVSGACEYGTRGGPGVAERVRLNAAAAGYRVRILVNTPRGATAGGFTLRIQNYP